MHLTRVRYRPMHIDLKYQNSAIRNRAAGQKQTIHIVKTHAGIGFSSFRIQVQSEKPQEKYTTCYGMSVLTVAEAEEKGFHNRQKHTEKRKVSPVRYGWFDNQYFFLPFTSAAFGQEILWYDLFSDY